LRHETSFFAKLKAAREMRVGPSESAWRRRFQTTSSRYDTTVAVVSVDGKP
jgi:hypothetical protein